VSVDIFKSKGKTDYFTSAVNQQIRPFTQAKAGLTLKLQAHTNTAGIALDLFPGNLDLSLIDAD